MVLQRTPGLERTSTWSVPLSAEGPGKSLHCPFGIWQCIPSLCTCSLSVGHVKLQTSASSESASAAFPAHSRSYLCFSSSIMRRSRVPASSQWQVARSIERTAFMSPHVPQTLAVCHMPTHRAQILSCTCYIIRASHAGLSTDKSIVIASD